MKYTIEQLEHLKNVLLLSFDGSFYDDKYNSDRGFFDEATSIFLSWIKKMERKNKIEELLKSMPKVDK